MIWLITDEALSAARAELVYWCSQSACLKTYTAEQLEELALSLAGDRMRTEDRVRREIADAQPPRATQAVG